MTESRQVWAIRIAVVALTATVALTGCSRLTTPAGEASAPPASVPASASTTSPTSDAATLGNISADLAGADLANTEADSNASAGDQAAAQDDNG
ncbi:hypothetical protein BH10ACT6_BH10ACT6_13750 [soil metagenome]